MPAQLTVLDKTNCRVPLKRLTPSESMKILGIQTTPDRNPDDQMEKLDNEATSFVVRLRGNGNKKRNDIWEAMTTRGMTSLGYGSRALTLTKAEWKTAMVKELNYCLPRSGICRYFPHTVLYGPKALQGLGPMSPWHSQELECLDFYWKAASYPQTLQGEVLKEVLDGLRLELGLPHNFTEANYKLLKPSTTPT